MENKYFRSTSREKMDKLGRIEIPERFRELIKRPEGEALVIVPMDNCIFGFKIEVFIKCMTSISERYKSNCYIDFATYLYCDSEGCIMIPKFMRDYANLEREIVFVGVIDHFEIWGKSRAEEMGTEIDLEMDQYERLYAEEYDGIMLKNMMGLRNRNKIQKF